MTCACGAPLTPRSSRCRRCAVNEAHTRYRQTEKFKAARARYRNSDKGRIAMARSGARRFWLGRAYEGRAQTPEQAARIRQHIKERVSAFIKGQSARAKAESA